MASDEEFTGVTEVLSPASLHADVDSRRCHFTQIARSSSRCDDGEVPIRRLNDSEDRGQRLEISLMVDLIKP